ncbi:MAG: M15 family metallopeptidase [Butyrivibrio sp.]|nr:M15 family metallopeptidase [Butyrivibrio sp.]
MNDKVKKDLIILLAVIIGASLCARYFAKGETLEEYAREKASDTSVAFVSQTQSDVPEDIQTNEAKEINKNSLDGENADHEISTKNDTDVTKNADSSSAEASLKKDASTDASVENMDAIEEPEKTGDNNMEQNLSDISRNFYYEPLSEDVILRITGISYVENPNVSLDDLRYLSLLYMDFNGETKKGEMICNKTIAQDLLEIFYELYNNGYQIESIKLIDEFGGDDTKSMLANNTSCFNYRVVEGSTKLSNHAYGLAVDINPFYNPYITYKDGITKITPVGSEAYADRTQDFPYKIDENDLAYKLFTAHGFKWGGNWNSVKDYQHFERSN